MGRALVHALNNVDLDIAPGTFTAVMGPSGSGIIAEVHDEPDWSVYFPLDEIEGCNTWILGQPTDRNKEGYRMIIVKATSVEEVLDIADQITALGYQAFIGFLGGLEGFLRRQTSGRIIVISRRLPPKGCLCCQTFGRIIELLPARRPLPPTKTPAWEQ
jgi:hypothetical protein